MMGKIIYFFLSFIPSLTIFPSLLPYWLSLLFLCPSWRLSTLLSFSLPLLHVKTIPRHCSSIPVSLYLPPSFPLPFIFPSYRRFPSRILISAEVSSLFSRVVATALCAFPRHEWSSLLFICTCFNCLLCNRSEKISRPIYALWYSDCTFLNVEPRFAGNVCRRARTFWNFYSKHTAI